MYLIGDDSMAVLANDDTYVIATLSHLPPAFINVLLGLELLGPSEGISDVPRRKGELIFTPFAVPYGNDLLTDLFAGDDWKYRGEDVGGFCDVSCDSRFARGVRSPSWLLFLVSDGDSSGASDNMWSSGLLIGLLALSMLCCGPS